MTTRDELEATIARIVQPGKGIVAADESMPTITKRFKAVGIDSTEETRRQYRQLLFTTRGVSEFVAGFILFEETLGQKADDGTPLAEVLVRQAFCRASRWIRARRPCPTPTAISSPRALMDSPSD